MSHLINQKSIYNYFELMSLTKFMHIKVHIFQVMFFFHSAIVGKNETHFTER